MPILPYDRAAAARYAVRWALARNPVYPDFTHLGGDCTNFISQCLHAGAPRMNFTPDTGWYYRSLADRAPAWSGVLFLHRFLLRPAASPGPAARESELSALLPGDVVFLHNGSRLYHAVLILTPGADPLVAAHTDDALYRPLSSYEAARTIPLHISGVHPSP